MPRLTAVQHDKGMGTGGLRRPRSLGWGFCREGHAFHLTTYRPWHGAAVRFGRHAPNPGGNSRNNRRWGREFGRAFGAARTIRNASRWSNTALERRVAVPRFPVGRCGEALDSTRLRGSLNIELQGIRDHLQREVLSGSPLS